MNWYSILYTGYSKTQYKPEEKKALSTNYKKFLKRYKSRPREGLKQLLHLKLPKEIFHSISEFYSKEISQDVHKSYYKKNKLK